MGEISDSIIDGEVCQICGTYLEPYETVYVHEGTVEIVETHMPGSGQSFGIPVTCKDCHTNEK